MCIRDRHSASLNPSKPTREILLETSVLAAFDRVGGVVDVPGRMALGALAAVDGGNWAAAGGSSAGSCHRAVAPLSGDGRFFAAGPSIASSQAGRFMVCLLYTSRCV